MVKIMEMDGAILKQRQRHKALSPQALCNGSDLRKNENIIEQILNSQSEL